MATRPASICLPVIQAASVAFRAYSPNAMLVPRLAAPARRPRCCLRYLTFLGILYSAIFDFGLRIADCGLLIPNLSIGIAVYENAIEFFVNPRSATRNPQSVIVSSLSR